MTIKNNWYLITSEELKTVKDQLQEVIGTNPDEQLDRIEKISKIIDSVEHRMK
jgi:hypothetical protein